MKCGPTMKLALEAKNILFSQGKINYFTIFSYTQWSFEDFVCHTSSFS
jgi:hypothetical protein